jgi:hypothetical protein
MKNVYFVNLIKIVVDDRLLIRCVYLRQSSDSGSPISVHVFEKWVVSKFGV